jgi:hypothetical protein
VHVELAHVLRRAVEASDETPEPVLEVNPALRAAEPTREPEVPSVVPQYGQGSVACSDGSVAPGLPSCARKSTSGALAGGAVETPFSLAHVEQR